MDNRHNEIFPSFLWFNEEFKPGNHLVDLFSDCFSFHLHSLSTNEHIEKLDDIAFRASSNPSSSIVMSDTSIKNHVATSISYIYLYDKPVIKMIHKVVNVTITEAKLFTI